MNAQYREGLGLGRSNLGIAAARLLTPAALVLPTPQEFKAKDAESAKAALGRFQVMAESVGHPIAKAALTDTSVILGLSTKEAQGVSLNDFILAARLNTVSLKDLQPARKRPVWA